MVGDEETIVNIDNGYRSIVAVGVRPVFRGRLDIVQAVIELPDLTTVLALAVTDRAVRVIDYPEMGAGFFYYPRFQHGRLAVNTHQEIIYPPAR